MRWKRILSQKRPAAGGEARERASFLSIEGILPMIQKHFAGDVYFPRYKNILPPVRKNGEKSKKVKKCSGFRKQIVMNCTYSGHEFRLL